MAGRSRGAGPLNLSSRPEVLYKASIERIHEADLALKHQRWALALYLAGLAVECILQAHALRKEPLHDARHDMQKWLKKCPEGFARSLSTSASSEWSRVVQIWSNNLRYMSESGVLGYLRRRVAGRGLKGGGQQLLKRCTGDFVDSAREVHKLGVAAWQSYFAK